MRVLIYSHSFAPQIGGVETYVKLLAEGLARRPAEPGCAVDVTVVTTTAAANSDDDSLPYRVVQNPGWPQLLGLIRAANVIHLAGPCFLPMLLGWCLRKAVVVEQHGYQAVCPNGLLLHEPTKTACPGISLPEGIQSAAGVTLPIGAASRAGLSSFQRSRGAGSAKPRH
jgi:hypothetical protein